jgi:hypothetical protein
MNHVSYYRSRCGSTYRIRVLTDNAQYPGRVLQARCSAHAVAFGPEYATHLAEVNRLLATGFLVELVGQTTSPI